MAVEPHNNNEELIVESAWAETRGNIAAGLQGAKTEPPRLPVTNGSRVFSISGLWLGSVREARADAFLMKQPHDWPEMWLPADCVFSVEPAGVSLIFERESLEQYEIAAPD